MKSRESQTSKLKVHRWRKAMEKLEAAELGRRTGVLRVAGKPWRFHLLVFPATATYWDVTQSPTFSPVSPTRFAEMPRLRQAVIIVVAELGVGRVTPRALQALFRWPRRRGCFPAAGTLVIVFGRWLWRIIFRWHHGERRDWSKNKVYFWWVGNGDFFFIFFRFWSVSFCRGKESEDQLNEIMHGRREMEGKVLMGELVNFIKEGDWELGKWWFVRWGYRSFSDPME